ncbi:hypothetical protein CBL_03139 [Carabus blaptoides fortunei]
MFTWMIGQWDDMRDSLSVFYVSSDSWAFKFKLFMYGASKRMIEQGIKDNIHGEELRAVLQFSSYKNVEDLNAKSFLRTADTYCIIIKDATWDKWEKLVGSLTSNGTS